MSELNETDLERAWREKREGFAAAADMVGRLLKAWEESQAECRDLRGQLVGVERDLTRLLDVVVHAGGRDWTAVQDAADRLKSLRVAVYHASGDVFRDDGATTPEGSEG